MNKLKTDDCVTGNDSLIEYYLAEIRKRLPVVDRTLELYGELPLSEYLDVVTETPSERYQSHEDLADVVYEYALPLLGEKIAAMAREELKQSPVVLTANHHGVDYFAQSVQGTLLFSQRKLPNGKKAKTVPVLACGSIAMNNLTYPRGALFYSVKNEQAPLRLPIFPDKVKRKLVARTAAFGMEMVERANARVEKLAAEGRITATSRDSMQTILKKHYSDDDVLAQSRYSDQAVLLNARLWREMMPQKFDSELVYLELEEIGSRLLQKDLLNEQSLIHILLFDQSVRVELMAQLNGAKGCWSGADLCKQKFDNKCSSGSGTFMFWGVDKRGRRISIGFDNIDGVDVLRAVDSLVVMKPIQLTPESIGEALLRGDLLPSLFSCYTAISLARGVICGGGYYQAEYLPVMLKGVLNALSSNDLYKIVSTMIEKVATNCYLSGVQMVMTSDNCSGLFPAGPIEIIAGGGLSMAELNQQKGLTVRQAHIASLSDTLADVVTENSPTVDVFTDLAGEISALQGDILIVK
jgi:hypothetical protein